MPLTASILVVAVSDAKTWHRRCWRIVRPGDDGVVFCDCTVRYRRCHPQSERAVGDESHPRHSLLRAQHKMHGFLALGAVVLCVTGGVAVRRYGPLWSALDSTGFGTRWSSRRCCSTILARCLSAFTRKTEGTFNPFYQITVVGAGSDGGGGDAGHDCCVAGVDFGRFSLTRQAVQLGYWPRVAIVHTSEDAEGQIYVPGSTGR